LSVLISGPRREIPPAPPLLVIILETVRIIANALSPIIPSLSLRIYTQLGFTEDQFKALRWVCSMRYMPHDSFLL
jgi:methionyl-tRNA synthetase